MSFILDALRKSEHERQRQSGPALVEVATRTPKARSNTWATTLVGLLVVNLVAIGVLLLIRSNKDAVAVTAPGGPAAIAPVPPDSSTAAASNRPGLPAASGTGVPNAQQPVPAAGAGSTPGVAEPAPLTEAASNPAQVPVADDAQMAPSEVPPPMLRPAGPLPAGARNPLAEEVSDLALPDEYLAGAASTPAGPPAVVAAGSGAYREPADVAGAVAPSQKRGSVVYQSIPEADPVTSPSRAAAAAPSTSGLPTADEVVAANGMPELKLELHVYANRPADRFVFINSHKYREGETLQEGATVESITRDGVVLSARGNRFLLPRD
jgi:general secretion pathway protein B